MKNFRNHMLLGCAALGATTAGVHAQTVGAKRLVSAGPEGMPVNEPVVASRQEADGGDKIVAM